MEAKYGTAGPCRFCGLAIVVTLMDENERYSVGHESPICAQFAAFVGRPPDRKGTVEVLPVDLSKPKGEA
jgi:hypothetical protein